VQKYLIKILFITLLVFIDIFPTESRIEAMGKRHVFFRDDMSIFNNPANIGVFGSFITGALGFVNDVSDTMLINPRLVTTVDTSLRINDTVIPIPRDSLVYDTVLNPKTAIPTNQWFGVVYNYAITKTIGAFGCAAFNRTDEFLSLYDSLRDTRKYRSDVPFPELKGITDFIFGARYNKINAGIGYYHASQHLVESNEKYEVSVSLDKINLGTEIGINKHSLEVFAGMGIFSYFNKNKNDSLKNIPEISDKSVFLGSRFFFKTKLGGGVVFVPAVNFLRFSLFDSTITRFSGGLGLNLRLKGGFFWCGVEGEKYSSENDSADIEVSGLGARFNFGIEKSLIWKWFIVRVGGSKYIGKQTVKQGGVTTDEWIENPVDDGTSDDFLGFGIGLSYQNRLRFDITLNEAVPYFNPFGSGLKHSSNGGHMVLRISSTFSL